MQDDIASLSEETLTRDIVIPLLQQIGYKDARYVHGMLEHGVDVLCTEETPFGGEFCGIQVKAVPISAAKSGKGGVVAELVNQASAALRHRYSDERDNTEKNLDKYFILTSATISDTAAVEIRDALREFGRRVRFVDGQALAQHVQKHLGSYVVDYFARRDMVSEFGHILRSHLQGLASDLEWLQVLLLRDHAGSETLRVFNRAQTHMQAVSREVRNYIWEVAAPKTLGKTAREVDIGRLLEAVATHFAVQAEAKRVRLKIQSEPAPLVATDPDALELVLSNLVDNAIRYSFHGTTVSLTAVQTRGNLRIDVANVGLPIPAAEAPHIWESRFRGSRARDASHSGSGLGLAVVKRLVAELGGTVEVVTRDCGSEVAPSGIQVQFTVSLPIRAKEVRD